MRAPAHPGAPSDPADRSTDLPQDPAAAVHALAALPATPRLADPAVLAELLGEEAEPTYVRIKPGESLIVAWRSAVPEPAEDAGRGLGERSTAECRHGFCAIFTDPAKITGALRRVAKAGSRIETHELGAGRVLLTGPASADPALAHEVHAVVRTRRYGTPETWTVLKYNPRRRLIVATHDDRTGEPIVLRIGTGPALPLVRATALWRSLGAPVLPSMSVGRRGTTSASPLWGAGDLHSHPDPATACAAGHALGALHAHSRAGATTGQETVLLHGDASPDQILVADPEEPTGQKPAIRIIDLDRATRGPAARDVGSWLAACEVIDLDRPGEGTRLATDFLTGYGATRDLDDTAFTAEVRRSQSTALRSRLDEPLRALRPDWQDRRARLVALALAASTVQGPLR
ncbi:aminoglycoside phosphotransferase family protein [Brevibacterium sp. 50QC2O2]|uniref:phosphotransferase family protein n=1 Tax=Brevibacterium sp. 50QC2O2 TaxID=2968459 RepID=UPI00211BAFDC|nr:aminoglycoside phosphotransferase family protein [Brevibacterium sp. 50QC2O2]MCQ9388901.1 aminoglycoside phosphotransferase family protein [Brevibacterium sp. 50QC2O2]